MQFLIGLLCGVAFFGAIILAYSAGRRVKTQPVKATDEDKRKAEQMQKHFTALFSYDVTTALKGKQVT